MSADKTAIVLIAYGSCLASGLAALRTFEARVRLRYPGIPVRWAYTSAHIRTRLALHVRRKSDSVVKAIQRLVLERFSPIIAQPLQIITATENESVEELTRTVSGELGIPVSVGQPLLASDEDVALCARAIFTHLPAAREPGEDVIFVGHGASHAAQSRYAQLCAAVRERDSAVHIATLSGNMRIETVLPHLSSARVWVVPFLSSIGKHTVSDIAGAGEGSVRSLLERDGRSCEVVKAGVLENAAFADIWLSHLDAAAARFGLAPVLDAADA
ncbi:MAG: sirohydrochlorin cobaltochelatase [Desulfovibrionaceae bacterium]|nr:sirohydrochlorin cobaltochelatase [Desulfovibrionaceae bacterium]